MIFRNHPPARMIKEFLSVCYPPEYYQKTPNLSTKIERGLAFFMRISMWLKHIFYIFPCPWRFQQLTTINYKLATDFEAKSPKTGQNNQNLCKKIKKNQKFSKFRLTLVLINSYKRFLSVFHKNLRLWPIKIALLADQNCHKSFI